MANPLGNQAAQYADAAVPTVGSINQQYQTGANDVHGFTTALIRLLQQGQGADPYASAVNSQSASNDAEMQRLQNLGSPNMPDSAMAGNPYGAGSAAAVGGMGNSALGALNQMRAAGISYQRQLPSIAAARGELANSTLLTNKQTALTQRSQQYQSAYMQALQQLRDYGLQKGQLNLSRQQLASQNANQAASLAEQKREFGINNSYRYAALATQTGASGPGSGLAKSLGLTQSELQSQVNTATKLLSGGKADTARVPVYGDPNNPTHVTGYKLVQVGGGATGGSAIQHGVPFQTAVNELIQQGGINPRVAVFAAARIYRTARSTNFSAWASFAHYMASHGNKQYQAIVKRMAPNPVQQKRGHG